MKQIYSQEFKLDNDMDFKSRLVVFQLQDGSWKRFYARTREKLVKLLKVYQPKNAYYSITRFNSPLELFKRGRIIDNLVMNGEILLDFDHRNVKKIKKAVKIMKDLDYKLIRFGSSGRGVHAVYDAKTRDLVTERASILGRLEDCGIDKSVTDIKRIARVLGTWNGNSCSWSRLFNANTGFERELKALDDQFNLAKNTMGRQCQAQLPPPYFALYISSKIPSCPRRQILCLRYKKFNESHLRALQERFNLGDLIALYDGSKYTILCLESLDFNRIKKIIRTSGSLEARDADRFGQKFIRLSPKFSLENKAISPEIKLVKVIRRNGDEMMNITQKVNKLLPWKKEDDRFKEEIRKLHKEHMFGLRQKYRICSNCGTTKNLAVHHKVYRIEFREEDMIVLCGHCHLRTHTALIKKRKVIELDRTDREALKQTNNFKKSNAHSFDFPKVSSKHYSLGHTKLIEELTGQKFGYSVGNRGVVPLMAGLFGK